MRRNPPKLEIRMGIATGEALVGTVGAVIVTRPIPSSATP